MTGRESLCCNRSPTSNQKPVRLGRRHDYDDQEESPESLYSWVFQTCPDILCSELMMKMDHFRPNPNGIICWYIDKTVRISLPKSAWLSNYTSHFHSVMSKLWLSSFPVAFQVHLLNFKCLLQTIIALSAFIFRELVAGVAGLAPREQTGTKAGCEMRKMRTWSGETWRNHAKRTTNHCHCHFEGGVKHGLLGPPTENRTSSPFLKIAIALVEAFLPIRAVAVAPWGGWWGWLERGRRPQLQMAI